MERIQFPEEPEKKEKPIIAVVEVKLARDGQIIVAADQICDEEVVQKMLIDALHAIITDRLKKKATMQAMRLVNGGRML